MEPDILPNHPDLDPASKFLEPLPQAPKEVGQNLQEAVQGGLGMLDLYLFSLRAGLLDWYFCLRQVQQDILRWVDTSLGLAVDCFFCWAQNALLACTMLLLLAWRVRSGIKERGWRQVLEIQFPQGATWLHSLLVRVAWAPPRSLFWLGSCLVRALGASFAQAVRTAREMEEELEKEEGRRGSSSRPREVQ